MLERLQAFKKRFEEINAEMNQPEVMADMKRYVKLNKDHKNLQPIVEACDKYALLLSNIESARDLMYNEKDEEFRAMAKEELFTLTQEKEKLEEEIRVMLIPADPEEIGR